MSSTTPNLGLFKYNPQTDGKEVFSITQALNNNWDLIDSRCGAPRNIGEIVTSTVPLTDAGLHLLDGSIIDGNGVYSQFVDYIANLWEQNPAASFFSQPHVETVYNYTTTGTVLNESGILQGFTKDNYCSATTIFPANSTSYEIVIKFRTTSVSTSVNIIGGTTTGSTACYNVPQIRIASSKLGFYGPKGTNITGTTTLTNSTWYWVKLTWDGTTKEFFLSTDGETYTSQGSYTTSTSLDGGVILLGNGAGESSMVPFTNGCIDLNECYMKVNNTLVWEGVSYLQLTAEQSWQESITYFGCSDKFVYNSNSNTVRLPKRTEEHGNLVKSYSAGTDWYRVYSDGWCEQGGMTTPSSSSSKIVTFNQPYVDTNYDVYFGNQFTGTATGTSTLSTTTKSVSGFTLFDGTNTAFYTTWMACGYIDTSKYQYSAIYEYIVLATSTKTAAQVDIDRITTDLNRKVDNSDLVEIQCVVDTYNDDTSWYRVYSDGWCEQGGTMIQNATSITMLYPRAFISNDYTLLVYKRSNDNDTGGYGDFPCAVTGASPYDYGQSITGFRCSTVSGNAKYTWEAHGYIL